MTLATGADRLVVQALVVLKRSYCVVNSCKNVHHPFVGHLSERWTWLMVGLLFETGTFV